MISILLLAVIIFTGYAVLIGLIARGWFRLSTFKQHAVIPQTTVSLIVAVRNEAENIKTLLSCILTQDYPPHLMEVIIVDDHSTDNTFQILNNAAAKNTVKQNLIFIKLEDQNIFGKKAALDTGIQKATGELIIITDADCTAKTGWISSLAAYYDEKKPKMILGPVQLAYDNNLFSKLQALEFNSLISSAAGSCRAGFPLLANAANMAFTRQAYIECGGFHTNLQYSSGDDMFLMMNIKKKFGARSVHFIKSPDAFVSTPAVGKFASFIQQRKRWVSKSKGYSDPVLLSAAILVYLTNLILVSTVCLAFIFPEGFRFFILAFLIKSAIDFPVMLSFSKFQRNVALMWLFPVLEFLNAFYTVLIGIAGSFGKTEWRGRRVSTKKRI